MSLPKFAVVDMDGDELPEVVYQRGDYMGFIVLRYKDGDIYGYDVNYRGLTGLKKDGSYSMSGGSSNTSVGKMRFLGKLFDTDIKFSSVEQESVSYYLNGKEIDEVKVVPADQMAALNSARRDDDAFRVLCDSQECASVHVRGNDGLRYNQFQ